MLEKDINDLLQDYKYRKNILEEITLDDIEKWNNMDVDGDWDKITNKPSTFTPSTHTHNFEDLLEKPTTLEGYGITDVYTKDEIQDNTLNKFKAINGKVLVDTGFNLGVKDGDNLISYNYGTSGAPTVKFGLSYDSDMYSYIDSYLGKLDLIASEQIYIRTPYLNLKVPSFSLSGGNGGFSVDVSDTYANNKVLASIPVEFTDSFKSPRINIYGNNNTVFEGSLYNSTYNINGTIKDGLHLRHEDGKYLVLGYRDIEKDTVYSYMICDVEGVLRNDSDGDDWGPIRFEQNVFFRHGLKIGGGEDIILAGKGVNTRITALENAITQGTGMVEWNNVLNKPSTFIPSSHSHTIADVTGLQSALDGKAASNHTHSYLPLSGGNLTGDITAQAINVGNSCPIRGRETSNGLYKTLVYMNSQNQVVLGSGSNSVTIQIPALDKLAIWDDATKKSYNIYHSGNFTPSNYLLKSGGTLTGDIILSNSTAIKGNISGTAQDLIKFGIYATQSESTLATIVGNSDNPTISLGKLYEGNYRVLNSNNFTSYCPSISDLSNYLPKSGGNVSGNIVLNNTIKISSKDKGGTVRDLIWMNNATNGEVVVGNGSNQVTFDIPTPKSLKIWCDGTQKSYEVYHSGNDPWRIKTLGKADMDTTLNSRGQGFLMKEAYNGTSSGYPKGYGNVLRMGGTGSNELFFEWCDGTAGMIYHRCLRDIGTSWTPWRRLAYADELSSYLPKSGGTMKGELALTQDKGIVSANVEGGTLLVETKSSVNVGKTTKNLNLNCSLAYMNGARVLTEYNYAYYVLPKTIFAGLFSPDKTIGTDSNAFYGYSKKTVYKSADCTVGTDRITISKAGIYKVTATWGGVPKSGTANTSAMRFTIQQKKSSAAIASKLDTITVTTLNRTAKSTVSYLFKCSANDYFIFFSYLCTVTFESEDVEIEIVRIS